MLIFARVSVRILVLALTFVPVDIHTRTLTMNGALARAITRVHIVAMLIIISFCIRVGTRSLRGVQVAFAGVLAHSWERPNMATW